MIIWTKTEFGELTHFDNNEDDFDLGIQALFAYDGAVEDGATVERVTLHWSDGETQQFGILAAMPDAD